MKLIFAQGNPGSDYVRTRHNVGWQLLDSLASAHGASFTAQPKFHAAIATLHLGGEKVLLAKPTTFYNETGRSARAIVDFYKLAPASDVLVIHDDLALPFGSVRTREKGSDAGNNGIKSLNSHLGSSYARMRIGIWQPLRDRMHDADFVLARFSATEQQALETYIASYVEREIAQFVAGKFSATSQQLLPDASQ